MRSKNVPIYNKYWSEIKMESADIHRVISLRRQVKELRVPPPFRLLPVPEVV